MAVLTPASFSLLKPESWMTTSFTALINPNGKMAVTSIGNGAMPSYSKITELLGNVNKNLVVDFPTYVPFFIDIVEPGKTTSGSFLLIYKKKIVSDQSIDYHLVSTYGFKKGDYVTAIRYAEDNSYKLVFYYDGKESLCYELLGIHSPENEKAFIPKKKIKVKNKTNAKAPVELRPKPRKRLIAKSKPALPVEEVKQVEETAPGPSVEEIAARMRDDLSTETLSSILDKFDLLNLSSLKLLQKRVEENIALKEVSNDPGDVQSKQVNPLLVKSKKISKLALYAKKLFKRN